MNGTEFSVAHAALMFSSLLCFHVYGLHLRIQRLEEKLKEGEER